MYTIDFNHPSSLYFVGIGGISMSGLAELLADAGFQVSGSDRAPSATTRMLEAQGITVFYGQKAENITDTIDCAVFTAAIRPDNPEYRAVHEKNLPCLTRGQLMGQVMKNYRIPIAVSGTHGKTTTTSMISEILLGAGLDPTLSVGGILKDIGGNMRIGHSDYFVTEACEYTNSFLDFFPKIGIILNIDEDHLDFFKDLEDIRHSFRRFAQLLPEDGCLIINGETERLEEIVDGLACRVVTFGIGNTCDYYATDIRYDEFGNPAFTLHDSAGRERAVVLSVPGEHNVKNALAAFALADCLSIDSAAAETALRGYKGTDRRFEYKGKVGGVTIIDDYAHHPTEITATLTAAANYPHRKLWCVFQPHTYTRTKAYLKEFAQSLSLADEVVLADIYAARETDTLGVHSEDLQREIQALGHECHYFPSFDEIENFLLENCINGDVLITMGAGDVVKIGENLLGS
ncbi:UDP-N-acetylmuramate--L-alanine ligase [Acetatifactor aquisgranensis]|uniref:UDP-N-acetylmuramate--L-alanine ligase n=1 Tax=Acetatifactor aquisgranensis TaxID=2941233 RepID=UPI002041EE34|nr:UDP-N-acetylmuramate--L-alanine ligase [Acetatifactor aquisgranensis]MCI8541712.1 UDP-N-acetylmuramate--L-alanine ligase [Lachnospiraceae bacterium]